MDTVKLFLSIFFTLYLHHFSDHSIAVNCPVDGEVAYTVKCH